jgi:hypothetical protein
MGTADPLAWLVTAIVPQENIQLMIGVVLGLMIARVLSGRP